MWHLKLKRLRLLLELLLQSELELEQQLLHFQLAALQVPLLQVLEPD